MRPQVETDATIRHSTVPRLRNRVRDNLPVIDR